MSTYADKTTKKKSNKTGIPEGVKNRFEQHSGYSFEDVRIHYNSEKPAQWQALAYTQGNQVYIAPGQEQHLEHELGHVTQQKQGRVNSTASYGGQPLNRDTSLEREADRMRNAPIQAYGLDTPQNTPRSVPGVIQMMPDPKAEEAKQFIKSSGVKNFEALYRRLTATFILPSDIISIGNVAKSMNAALSVRESGKHTLAQLSKGAGAKGHSILEKTIKESSLGIASFDALGADLPDGYFPGIEGLVAHWDKRKEKDSEESKTVIEGLYLTPIGSAFFAVKKEQVENIVVKQQGKHEILCTDTGERRAAVQNILTAHDEEIAAGKIKTPWQSYFYTGDYDLHEMISFTGRPAIVPSESKAEKDLITGLNDEIGKDTKITGVDIKRPEYQRIQHGPQASYIAHNLAEEPGQAVVAAVAGMSPPVAMCTKGKWSVLDDKSQIFAWYEENCVQIKSTWDTDTEGADKIEQAVQDTNALVHAIFFMQLIYPSRYKEVIDGLFKEEAKKSDRAYWNNMHSDEMNRSKLGSMAEKEIFISSLSALYHDLLVVHIQKKYADKQKLIETLNDSPVGKKVVSACGLRDSKKSYADHLNQLTWKQLHRVYIHS